MMKKNVLVLGLLLSLLLGSCQGIFTPTPPTEPTVDSAATSDALFKTAVAQTLTALPTLPSPSMSDTPTVPVASPSPVVPATDTPTTVSQVSPTPVDLTALSVTGTNEIPTATLGLSNGTPNVTATLASGQVTAIWTLAVRKYGTLPPAVPFRHITLVNKANAEAYISLHVDLDGSNTVIEYPVEGRIRIEAPTGFYTYVAWVGGRKMVGEFKLRNDDLTITLFKDKVVIK
jgi:hypothetical protein